MNRYRISAMLFALCLALSPAFAGDGDWQVIFDGKSLDGWHVSTKTGHSRTSNHESGGSWVVRDGAIDGSQDRPGNGGIIITDASYADFEVKLEMNNDFGLDSGLFLRSTEEGKCYQATIDYHGTGDLMGIYGEGLGGRPNVYCFSFDGAVDKIKAVSAPVELPVLPESWPHFWRAGEWNELRARIVGNPPTITTWINGVKFMEWSDREKRLPDAGGIALQIHGGGDHKEHVRYRNIQVRMISP